MQTKIYLDIRYILRYVGYRRINMYRQINETKEDERCGRRHFVGHHHEHRGPRGWFETGFGGGRDAEFEGRGRHAGFGGGRRGRFERGFGGRERLFDSGDLKLVIVKLLSEQPSYGYQ